jgi:Zn-dependent protease/CBS domain-containing protein
MRWSLRIGTLAGVTVNVHATFLLLLGWVALSHWLTERTADAVANGLLFILAVFACVVLHELGHALAARRYGIPTKDITLLPIGGVARLARMPEDPRQELVVALAGPAVNVAIAALLFVLLAATATFQTVEELGMTRGSLVQRLMLVNVSLVAFNLLPAFPMDGGRVLRAILATRTTHASATRIAAAIGQGTALVLGFVGLFTNPFLVFVALFVWIGAAQEAGFAQARSSLAGLPVRAAMLTDFQGLAPGESLSRAAALLLSGSQTDFPVLQEGRVAGILRRNDLIRGLTELGGDATVEAAMTREFRTADVSESLEAVFERLQGTDCRTVPVLRGGLLVGVVTTDNIGELIMIRTALEARETRPGVPRPASS